MMPRKDIPVGTRFGHLVVVGKAQPIKHRSASVVRCDCGTVKTLVNCALTSWVHTSCGCMVGKNLVTHGESKSRLFKIWANMIERCSRNRSRYRNYYGRGIRVCDEWRSDFKAFRDWARTNGYSDSLSIDRIDVNGNYEPSNCRWIPMREQMRNRTTNVRLTAFGQTLTVAEWARKIGINEGTLRTRLSRLHWSPEKALSTTTNKRKKQCI